jgi:hypothetical protein
MLSCAAWKSLPAVDLAIFIELSALYNGSNNGSLGYSVRTAAESPSVSPQQLCVLFSGFRTRIHHKSNEGSFQQESPPCQ